MEQTAFLTASCRASLPLLSQDTYAHLWQPGYLKVATEYMQQVSLSETLALALRNNFFLKEIKSFTTQNQHVALVNFGSGFSSYPYLLPTSITHIEIDREKIVKQKQTQASNLQNLGLLPQRNICYLAADLNNPDDLKKIFYQINKLTQNKKTFFLFEGILYYLKQISLHKIFEYTAYIQKPGDILALNTWSPNIATSQAYQKFITYTELTYKEFFDYLTFHNTNDLQNIKGYKIIKQTNSLSLLQNIQGLTIQNPSTFLNEDHTILKKAADPPL